MKPVEFAEMNCTYAENQSEYLPLPVLKKEGVEGEVNGGVKCWADLKY